MSPDRETTRIVRSWLEEGATELPDRVLDAVLDQVPATPQRSAWWPARRYADVNNTLKVALSAAAVVVIALIGINLLPSAGGAGAVVTPSAASPSTSPAPTASPGASPSTAAASGLPLGPFVLTAKGTGAETSIIETSVTIGAEGWYGEVADGILTKNENSDPPDGAATIIFTFGDGWYVPGDPCHYDSTLPASRSTTVDDLIAALAAQSSRDASAPADITVDGYAGKSITLHVPDDAVFADCDHGKFCTLADAEAPGADGDTCYRHHQGPGQIDNMWVVDVDGQLVVIDWNYFAGTPAEDVAELEAIIRSMTFE